MLTFQDTFDLPPVQLATAADVPSLLLFWAQQGLPIDEIWQIAANQYFWFIQQGPSVIASVGLEVYSEGGVIRSFALAESLRGQGLGGTLLHAVLNAARQRHLPAIFCLAEHNAEWFLRHGFAAIRRQRIPDSILRTGQFTEPSLQQAACLMHRL